MADAESILVPQPKFYERDQHRNAQNRRWWFVTGFLGLTTVLALLIVLASVTKREGVIAFDSKGQPFYYDDTTTARHRLDDMRIEYFAQQFIRRVVGINGPNLDQEIAEAVNMMTPRRQQIVVHDADFMQRRAKYRDANLRSSFTQMEFKIAPYEPEDKDGKIYVMAWGRLDFVPHMGEVEGNGPKSIPQFFLSSLILERQPMRRDNIAGLSVDRFDNHYFQNEDDLKVYVLKSQS